MTLNSDEHTLWLALLLIDLFIHSYDFCLASEGKFLDTEMFAGRAVSRPFLDATTPWDSYAWNYREVATALTLSESSA